MDNGYDNGNPVLPGDKWFHASWPDRHHCPEVMKAALQGMLQRLAEYPNHQSVRMSVPSFNDYWYEFTPENFRYVRFFDVLEGELVHRLDVLLRPMKPKTHDM